MSEEGEHIEAFFLLEEPPVWGLLSDTFIPFLMLYMLGFLFTYSSLRWGFISTLFINLAENTSESTLIIIDK